MVRAMNRDGETADAESTKAMDVPRYVHHGNCMRIRCLPWYVDLVEMLIEILIIRLMLTMSMFMSIMAI